ncbi:MAG: MarR family transcriptional regulator [Bacteroidetes bacterium]|nr:MarR family transcriptional regulator [Bacteroidota bacterium]
MEKLNSVLFYSIEKAIKTYRQFAQKELKNAGLTITVDQWLTLKSLSEHPDMSQKELAEMIFKDTASITRIIELLVQARYLKRTTHKEDKRKTTLTVTELGTETIEAAEKVVESYRKQALKGIGLAKIQHVKAVMNTIINNCH